MILATAGSRIGNWQKGEARSEEYQNRKEGQEDNCDCYLGRSGLGGIGRNGEK